VREKERSVKPVLRRSYGGDERNVSCGWNYDVEEEKKT
jgi:hypothetical protein